MHRMQICERVLDSHQIRLAETTTNIDVAGHESGTVRDCGKSTHKNEFDVSRDQPAQKFSEILHDVFSSQREGIPRSSAHHRWQACAPKASSRDCHATGRYPPPGLSRLLERFRTRKVLAALESFCWILPTPFR